MKYMTSEAFVRNRRNINFMNMGLILLIIPTTAILTLLLKGHRLPPLLLPILGGVMLFIAAEMVVLTLVIVKKMRKVGYLLTENGIARLDKKGEPMEPLNYAAMSNVKIVTLKTGLIRSIVIKSSTPKKGLAIIGLDNMDEVATTLRKHLEPERLNEKTSGIDWHSPKVNVLTFIITLVAMALLFLLGEKVALFGADAILIAFGLYILIGKPMTKYYGKKWRPLEVILSLLIIAGKLLGWAAEFWEYAH